MKHCSSRLFSPFRLHRPSSRFTTHTTLLAAMMVRAQSPRLAELARQSDLSVARHFAFLPFEFLRSFSPLKPLSIASLFHPPSTTVVIAHLAYNCRTTPIVLNPIAYDPRPSQLAPCPSGPDSASSPTLPPLGLVTAGTHRQHEINHELAHRTAPSRGRREARSLTPCITTPLRNTEYTPLSTPIVVRAHPSITRTTPVVAMRPPSAFDCRRRPRRRGHPTTPPQRLPHLTLVASSVSS